MKLQLDTTKKTIKLESNVKISELVKTPKKLFPNGEWQDFTLETNVTIHGWSSPIFIKTYPTVTYPTYPWYEKVWCDGSNSSTTLSSSAKSEAVMSLKAGMYNVEV